MLWKWLTYDVDMHKRRNKILTILCIFAVATFAWIYIIPVINPAGSWLCRSENNRADLVMIHENTSSGYTVIILPLDNKNMNAQGKSNIISAWVWRVTTLRNYLDIKPVVEGTKLDDLRKE